MQVNKLSQKYTLLERIAEGSYGEVYKARDKSTKELVAVKRFKAGGKIGLPISFVRQHYIMSTISGKYLPTVFDVFSNQQPPVIVMEWFTSSLQQVLKSKKKYAIKQFFQEIVLAVDHLHSNSILHRDLKPSNIMLATKSTGSAPTIEPLEIIPEYYSVKLIDYGMSREQAWENKDMTNQVGTLFYRAPELLLGQKRYNTKIDIWSLGCIFYFMQTGSLVFKGTCQIDQFKTIVTILGTDMSSIKHPRMKEALSSMKMESLPQNWSLVDKHLNEIEFDLLKKMIALEPEKRLGCKDLLMHPYFM